MVFPRSDEGLASCWCGKIKEAYVMVTARTGPRGGLRWYCCSEHILSKAESLEIDNMSYEELKIFREKKLKGY